MASTEWNRPKPELLERAKGRALAVLDPEVSTPRLRRYYDVTTDYAGRSFATIGVNDPHSIGADDLFAITLLSVSVPAGAARLITDEGETRDAITAAMAELPQVPLQEVDDDGLVKMEVFYRHVKRALAKAGVENSNPWVTASKLAARKRPDLFPVRDRVVCSLLGLMTPKGDYQVDWQVFRHLAGDAQVREEIEHARTAALDGAPPTVQVEDEPLRVLDAALWSSITMPDPEPDAEPEEAPHPGPQPGPSPVAPASPE